MADPSPPLFVQSTRYVHLFREQYPEVSADIGVLLEGVIEHEITIEAVEEISAYEDLPTSIRGDAWKQFETLCLRGLVWLGTDVVLTIDDFSTGLGIGYWKRFTFASSRTVKYHVLAAPAATQEDLALAGSFFLRLLETSGATILHFEQTTGIDQQCVISGPTLSRFMIECTSLETFVASGCTFCESHIRATRDASSVRPELEIDLVSFGVTPEGKVELVASLQRNAGPTMIASGGRDLDYQIFVDGLPGNTRLTTLEIFPCNLESNVSQDIAALVRSFSRNKGLKKLKLGFVPLSDENWGLFCEALPEHPALTSFAFNYTGPSPTDLVLPYVAEEEMSEAAKVFRVQQVVELLQKNKVLTDVDLNFRHDLIGSEIEPRLRINRFRPKFKEITRAPYAWRRQLVGRALGLGVVREDPTLQFMLLVQNEDVLF